MKFLARSWLNLAPKCWPSGAGGYPSAEKNGSRYLQAGVLSKSFRFIPRVLMIPRSYFLQSIFSQASGAGAISVKKKSLLDRLGPDETQKKQGGKGAQKAAKTEKAGLKGAVTEPTATAATTTSRSTGGTRAWRSAAPTGGCPRLGPRGWSSPAPRAPARRCAARG